MFEDYREKLESIKRSPGTIKNILEVLNRVQKFLGDTPIEKASEQQLMAYFKTVKSLESHNIQGSIIMNYLRFKLKIKNKRQRPPNMEWYEWVSKDRKEKEKHHEGIKRFLITPEEYEKLLEVSIDKYGLWEGLWEAFSLSGGREKEVWSMQIKHVIIDKTANTVTLALPESKTKPREVPLSEYPHKLIRWLGNHPQRDNPEAPLWVIPHKNERMSIGTIKNTFWRYKKKAGIKNTLSVHCFRKTLATKMFNMRSKDGGLIYGDTEMALFFGWKPETVAQRRKEYDLTSQEDLKKHVFGTGYSKQIESFDVIKQEKEAMETNYKQRIYNLEKTVSTLLDKYQSEIEYRNYDQELKDAEKESKEQDHDWQKQIEEEDHQNTAENIRAFKKGSDLILNKMIAGGRSQKEIDQYKKTNRHSLKYLVKKNNTTKRHLKAQQ
jgi:integrase